MRFSGYKRYHEYMAKTPEEAEKRQIPWGKYIYLTVLILILLGLFRLGVRRYFFIEGLGVLDAERIEIAGSLSGRISTINCRINEMVSQEEPLVVLNQPELEHEVAAKEMELESELRLLEKEMENRMTMVEDLRETYRSVKHLLTLNAVTLPRFLEIEADLKSSEGDLSLLRTRIELTRSRLTAFRNEYYDDKKDATGKKIGGPDQIKETVLYAPTDGLVTSIYKQEGEFTGVGEPIIEIADLSKIFIKAYFGGSDENDIVVGEEVTILFENGDKTSGKIVKVYPATLPLPAEFLKQYELKERYIIAEIVPKSGVLWPAILATRAKVSFMRSRL